MTSNTQEVLDKLDKAIQDTNEILDNLSNESLIEASLYSNFVHIFATNDADVSGEDLNYYQTVAQVGDNPDTSSESLEKSWGFRAKTDGFEDSGLSKNENPKINKF